MTYNVTMTEQLKAGERKTISGRYQADTGHGAIGKMVRRHFGSSAYFNGEGAYKPAPNGDSGSTSCSNRLSFDVTEAAR